MINPSKPYNLKPALSKTLFHPKYLLTWSGLLILFLLSKLPFKLTLLMGKILGLLLYLFAKKRRKIAEINLVKTTYSADLFKSFEFIKISIGCLLGSVSI